MTTKIRLPIRASLDRRLITAFSTRHFAAALVAISLIAAAFLYLPSAGALAAEQRAQTFTLDNGMEVVIVPDHRAPVAVHMVWYRIAIGYNHLDTRAASCLTFLSPCPVSW